MAYYLRLLPDSGQRQAWEITDRRAIRIDVSNAENGAGTCFDSEAGETIWDCIRRQTPWFEPAGENPFHKLSLGSGQYYPRIARPIGPQKFWCPGTRVEKDAIAVAGGQLTALTRQLSRICQTVHPTAQTFGTFGHDIRNLLILACTEVEAHWRGVLVKNQLIKKSYTTNDYSVLTRVMKLDEYAVAFPQFPWLSDLKPFDGWGSTGKPSQELKWYSAYNAAKHNREAEFERATLGHVFAAISACAVMMVAQYGDWKYSVGQSSEASSFFALSSRPSWSVSDEYLFPYTRKDWEAVPFDFSAYAQVPSV
jgi:hypothetical protein